MPTDTYTTAQALASDLAEDELRANIADMFIEHAGDKAKAIRARSEAKKGWFGAAGQTPEDQYHFTQSSIYGAVYALLEGYKGWRLVKDPSPVLTTPAN